MTEKGKSRSPFTVNRSPKDTDNRQQTTENAPPGAIDQQSKNLEYLRDYLLNGTVSIMGCLKQIENYLEYMTEVLHTYEKDLVD